MSDPRLFDPSLSEVLADSPAPTHRDDPATSKVAAASVKAGTQRGEALLAVVAAGDDGLTGHECCAVTSCMWPASATTRLNELVAFGMAERDGRTRLTASGCPALVSTATPLGRERATELREVQQ